MQPDSGLTAVNTAGSVALTATPAAGGTATVTVTVGDGTQPASRSFLLTVTDPAVDQPPVLSTIPAQTTTLGTPKTLQATVTDDKTPAGNVTVTGSSSDTAVLPDSGIQVVNTGGTLALTLTPTATGTTTITLTANDGAKTSTGTFTLTVNPAATPGSLSEGFEGATKGGYAAGPVTLSSGSWQLEDALLGNQTADLKVGAQSARVRNTGKVRMNFDLPSGAKTVTLSHGAYGTDANSTWELWSSVDGGTNWAKVGDTQTAKAGSLTEVTFTPNLTGTVRFELRKLTGGSARINFDEIRIVAP